MGIRRTPIKLIRLAPESIVKTPRADAVINVRNPRAFENARIITERTINMEIDR